MEDKIFKKVTKFTLLKSLKIDDFKKDFSLFYTMIYMLAFFSVGIFANITGFIKY